MQDIYWLLLISFFFYIAFRLNAWVIPFTVMFFWPNFVGVREPMNYTNAMLIAVVCMWVSIFFSRAMIAVIIGIFLGKAYANKARNK